MNWIDYALIVFLAVMIFWAGFFCGYVKDKKEVADDLRTAKEYSEEAEKKLNEAKENSEEAEKRLNEAQRLLDKAHDYYEETHTELERLKEEWGMAATEADDEGSGGL